MSKVRALEKRWREGGGTRKEDKQETAPVCAPGGVLESSFSFTLSMARPHGQGRIPAIGRALPLKKDSFE